METLALIGQTEENIKTWWKPCISSKEKYFEVSSNSNRCQWRKILFWKCGYKFFCLFSKLVDLKWLVGRGLSFEFKRKIWKIKKPVETFNFFHLQFRKKCGYHNEGFYLSTWRNIFMFPVMKAWSKARTHPHNKA